MSRFPESYARRDMPDGQPKLRSDSPTTTSEDDIKGRSDSEKYKRMIMESRRIEEEQRQRSSDRRQGTPPDAGPSQASSLEITRPPFQINDAAQSRAKKAHKENDCSPETIRLYSG